MAENDRALNVPVNAEVARKLMLRIDAEVLRLYDLPPRSERQILDLFAGWETSRSAVPFRPLLSDDMSRAFPCMSNLSSAYETSTAGYLRNQTEPRIPAEGTARSARGRASL